MNDYRGLELESVINDIDFENLIYDINNHYFSKFNGVNFYSWIKYWFIGQYNLDINLNNESIIFDILRSIDCDLMARIENHCSSKVFRKS